MSGDLGEDYERDSWQEYDNVVREIGTWPEFAGLLTDPGWPSGPAVELRCPREHPLLTVLLQRDHDWRPYLYPVHGDDVPERSTRAAFEAGPWGPGRTVCAEPGCPVIAQPGRTTCTRHRRPEPDVVSSPRTGLTCGRCNYDGRRRQATLLKMYALAVRLGHPSIRLPN